MTYILFNIKRSVLRIVKNLALLTLVALYITSCGHNESDDHATHDHDHETHQHEHEGHGHDHDHEGHDHEHEGHDHDHDHEQKDANLITLSPQMAKQFGVVAQTVTPAPFRSSVKVWGTLTDSPDETAVIVAPYSGTVTFRGGIAEGSTVRRGQAVATINSATVAGGNPNSAAKAAMDAAKRELDRLTPLYNDRLVTASEYNAAVRAYDEARASYSSGAASGAATAPIGGTLLSLAVPSGSYVNAGEVIATVGSATSLRLKAELPVSDAGMLSSINDARFRLPGSNISKTVSSLGGRREGASTRTTSPGYIPVYFSLSNDGSLVAGTPVTVWLLADEKPDVLSVPVSALSEQQGMFYVYIKLDEDCYRRIPVTLGENDGDRVEILSGLTPGLDVVVNGAVTVKNASNTSAIPAHSHSH